MTLKNREMISPDVDSAIKARLNKYILLNANAMESMAKSIGQTTEHMKRFELIREKNKIMHNDYNELAADQAALRASIESVVDDVCQLNASGHKIKAFYESKKPEKEILADVEKELATINPLLLKLKNVKSSQENKFDPLFDKIAVFNKKLAEQRVELDKIKKLSRPKNDFAGLYQKHLECQIQICEELEGIMGHHKAIYNISSDTFDNISAQIKMMDTFLDSLRKKQAYDAKTTAAKPSPVAVLPVAPTGLIANGKPISSLQFQKPLQVVSPNVARVVSPVSAAR